MATAIYVLGGYQTDFAANWARSGREIADGLREVLEQGLGTVDLEPRDLQTAHVGNFAAELSSPPPIRTSPASPPRATRAPAPPAASPRSPPRPSSRPAATASPP